MIQRGLLATTIRLLEDETIDYLILISKVNIGLIKAGVAFGVTPVLFIWEVIYMSRKAGILLPIFSLPSEYGIGTLGRAAYRWVDFLNDAHQKLWQVLPVGPTSYGDSPYQSFSAFAGNPYFIDLELLCDQKLLTKDECAAIQWEYTSKKNRI